MNLKVLLPGEILVDEPIESVTVEAPDGALTLLPRHIDFVSALVPGILYFRAGTQDGEKTTGAEHYVALDDGILVKKGSELLVVTRNGVRSEDLEDLRRLVVERFYERDQHERRLRTVLAHLESNFMKRFIELE